MQLFSVFSLILLSVIVTRGESKSIASESRILSRVKRVHLGTFSSPESAAERNAIKEVINQWIFWGATGRQPGEIYRSWNSRVQARIDLQGIELINGITHERFAVQIESRTYAVVHIQRGDNFGVGLIRNAFEVSRDHMSHIFLTETGARINIPNDGNQYDQRSIRRCWNKKTRTISVWGVNDAISRMVVRFDEGIFPCRSLFMGGCGSRTGWEFDWKCN